MEYLLQCKLLYDLGITPSNQSFTDRPEYSAIINTARDYFESGRLDEFIDYLSEGQYFVQLWTAHLILEYGNPSQEEIDICINEIEKYSQSSIDSVVAEEERQWLEENKNNYITM